MDQTKSLCSQVVNTLGKNYVSKSIGKEWKGELITGKKKLLVCSLTAYRHSGIPEVHQKNS